MNKLLDLLKNLHKKGVFIFFMDPGHDDCDDLLCISIMCFRNGRFDNNDFVNLLISLKQIEVENKNIIDEVEVLDGPVAVWFDDRKSFENLKRSFNDYLKTKKQN